MYSNLKTKLVRPHFWNVFRKADFRLMWGASILAAVGHSTESVVLGWWVLQLTNSPVLLGYAFAWSRATRWLGPVFGVIADRYDRRKLWIFFQLTDVTLYLLLGVISLLGIVQLWHIIALFTMLNLSVTANSSIQNPLIQDAVGGENLLTALAFLAFSNADMAAFAAPLAGLAYNWIGPGGLLVIFAAISSIPIPMLLMIKMSKASRTKETAKKESLLKSLVEGLKYVWSNHTILAILLITSLWNLLIYPYNSLISVMARDYLDVDALGLGILVGMASLGQVAASLSLSSLGDLTFKGKWAVLSSISIGLFLIFFSISRSYLLSLALLFGMGVAQIAMMTLTNCLLLLYVPSDLRGRVMGVRMQLGGGAMIPFGTLMAGTLSGISDVPFTLGLFGTVFTLSTSAIALLQPKLRKL